MEIHALSGESIYESLTLLPFVKMIPGWNKPFLINPLYFQHLHALLVIFQGLIICAYTLVTNRYPSVVSSIVTRIGTSTSADLQKVLATISPSSIFFLKDRWQVITPSLVCPTFKIRLRIPITLLLSIKSYKLLPVIIHKAHLLAIRTLMQNHSLYAIGTKLRLLILLLLALPEVVKHISISFPRRRSNGVRPPSGSSSTASNRAMVILTLPSVRTPPRWGYLSIRIRIRFGAWNTSHISFSEDQLSGRMIQGWRSQHSPMSAMTAWPVGVRLYLNTVNNSTEARQYVVVGMFFMVTGQFKFRVWMTRYLHE